MSTDLYNRIRELITNDEYPKALEEIILALKKNPLDEFLKEKFLLVSEKIINGNADFDAESSSEFMYRGIAKFYKGDMQGSLDDLKQAIKLDPKNHYAYKNLGFNYTRIGKYSFAIENLNKAISIFESGEYYDDLADTYFNMGDSDTALKYHLKAVEVSPDDARLWYNFGVSYMELGNNETALKHFDKAIELWPQYEDALHNRKHILNLLNK